jgi:RNA polymerase sigma-70 factor (ECF subfamily)
MLRGPVEAAAGAAAGGTRAAVAARVATGREGGGRPDATAEPAALRLDEEEFTALYHRLARPLRAYLRRLAGDAEAADDLLQETFYRFLRAELPALDDRQATAYLYRTATRLVQDGWRRAARERRRDGQEAPPAATPARDRTLAHDVERCLRELKPRERALLWLAHVEGADHREIAAVLGVAEPSVRVLLFRARRRLAAVLEKRGLEDRR